jgi:tRNA threonylcarbamoyladenosine biosynthesis protein TsaB
MAVSFRAAPSAAEGATLAIEAATPRGSVALVRDGRILAEVPLPAGVQVSASYVPALSALFAAAGDVAVARVAVSAGPGSFTGLRVGLSAAKGLCLPLALPLVAVPTLDALALAPFLDPLPGAGPGAAVPAGAVICPILDARKKEIYCAAYAAVPPGSAAAPAAPGPSPEAGAPLPGGFRPLLPAAPRSPEAFLALLPGDGPLYFLGDGVDAFAPLLSSTLGARALLAPPPVRHPRAGAVGLLGERLGRSGGEEEASKVLPRYLRRSEAEEHAVRGA